VASNSATNRIGTILASNIRLARDEKRLTQSQLGRLVGVDNQLVSNWERGRGRPSDANLVRLSDALERDLAWFYTDHDTAAAA
jgi:transcriptional regulator with XRE-family HTH domain